MALSKQKDAAPAATDPRHGSTNPTKDMDMNIHSHITDTGMAAREFPIPYPGQTPDNDLSVARRLLEIATTVLEVHRANSTDSLVFNALCEAREKLVPIQRFLDDLDYSGMTADYAGARRAVILESWEAAR